MATIKQEKFVKNMLENVRRDKPQSLGLIATQSGYGKISKQPSRILKSKGILELFEKAGISATKIAKEYNKLLAIPVRATEITPDQKRKLLDSLSNIVINNPESKLAPTFQFIDKYLDINKLGLNRPKERTIKEKPIEVINEQ